MPKSTKALEAIAALKQLRSAPSVIVPGKLSELEKAVLESKGQYGAKRVQKAADEIKNLEQQFKLDALKSAFLGDNAKALMIGKPAEFQRFAAKLEEPYRPAVERYWWEMSPQGGGAADVPFLEINRQAPEWLPNISGHEGRHRNIAMDELGHESTLWSLLPRAALREHMPRRSQEEYLEALKQELGLNRFVTPESRSLLPIDLSASEHQNLERRGMTAGNRPELPEPFADGGKVKRRDINEFKALGAPAAMPQPRTTKVSQFEKDYREMLANQQAAREQLTSDLISPSRVANVAVPGAVGALTGYGSQILGAPGDIVGLYEEFKPESFRSAPASLQALPSTEQVQELFAPKADSMIGRSMPEYEAGITGGNMYALGEGVAALPSLARGVGRGAKAVGKEAGRRIDEAMMTGEGLLGSALAPARPNFMFIGPKSAAWNAAAASKAQQMERAGKSPQEIWAATGTFKAADGNWRQEISDQPAQFRKADEIKALAAGMKGQEDAYKLAIAQSKLHPDLFPKQLTAAQKDIRAKAKGLREERTAMHGPETNPEWRGNFAPYALEHPELYAAYPELSKAVVVQGGKGLGGAKAGIVQGKNDVDINIYEPGLRDDPRSSILHEMQHAIQGIEGWAPGGSTVTAFQHPEAHQILQELRNVALTPMSFEDYAQRYSHLNDIQKGYEQYKASIPAIVKKMGPSLQADAATKYYERLAGEAEARATQARRNMGVTERAQTPPATDYDVPLEEQIVRPAQQLFRDGGTVSRDAMQMAAWDKQVQRKGMGGWMKGAGRTAEEAKRLFDIAKGTRAKAAQVEAGLYHPIGGGIKLSKPVELMQFETMKDPTVKGVQRKIITPEDLQGGIGIPLVGDRAAGGTLLTSVEGIPFRSPLTLEAGPDYMLTHTIPGSPESSIWRSGKGVISGLQKQVEFARDMGRPIYGVNVVGAPTNVNYNTMVTEAILNQYDPTALTKKAKKEFLKDIRNYAPDPDKPHLKPGSVLTEADLNDVEALRAKMLAEGAGPLRKAFVERMGQAPFQEAGFPDVPASRLATTEPLLVDVPTGSAGFTVGTIDPAARALEQTPRGHKTYPVALAGEYFGSLGQPIDYRNIFQEFADKRRLFGKPEGSDWRSFSLSPQFQTFDQEWLDRVMKSAGADKPREWKKGGTVHKAGGGIMKKAGQIIGKAAESSGMARPVTAAKDLTTLQDFHTSLGDRIREGVAEANKMMEGFDYKYDKGQRVFTKDSAAKNRNPYEILERTRVGNQIMYDTSGGGMKQIKDPETGRAKRTPYEPGYRVRSQQGEDDSEFIIPASAIIGDVEMARGGVVHKAEGGMTSDDLIVEERPF